MDYDLSDYEWGSLKGLSPFKNHSSPSPLKERGTEGVR